MKQKILNNTKAIILGLVLTLGVSYVMGAWTNPACAPTGCNADAPVTVGGRDGSDPTRWYSQAKSGILSLAYLITPNLTVTNSDTSITNIPDGAPLVADGANTGKVKWGAVTAGIDYAFAATPNTACRMNTTNGATVCKKASGGYGGYSLTWTVMSSPFSATTLSRYNIMCPYSTGYVVYDGSGPHTEGVYTNCCRANVTTGSMECKTLSTNGTTWYATWTVNPF